MVERAGTMYVFCLFMYICSHHKLKAAVSCEGSVHFPLAITCVLHQLLKCRQLIGVQRQQVNVLVLRERGQIWNTTPPARNAKLV